MDILDNHLKNGTPVYHISFVGFTVTSCTVASERAIKYAPELATDKMWFRTIHSTCFELVKRYWKQNGIKFKQPLSYQHQNDFCRFAELDLPIKDDDVTDGTGDLSTGSAFFATATYMANSMLPIDQWTSCPHAAPLIKAEIDFTQIYAEYGSYKHEHNLMDYDDMLLICADNNLNVPTTILIVDEAQDLSPLQYKIITNWMQDKTHVYLGGDDDQCIYVFQGANSSLMLKFPSNETLVLPKTHRCPPQIWNAANKLISRNKVRQPKKVEPSNQIGSLKVLQEPEMKEIKQFINTKKNVFLLVRTNALVNKLAWRLADEQIVFKYTTDKKEQLYGWTKAKIKIINQVACAFPHINKRKLLRDLMTKSGLIEYDEILHEWKKGEYTYAFMEKYIGKTIDYDQIKTQIGTIHSVKGNEADIVILFNDLTNKITVNLDNEQFLEDERKVWYVGMTRSKLILVIVDGFFVNDTKSIGFQEIVDDNLK